MTGIVVLVLFFLAEAAMTTERSLEWLTNSSSTPTRCRADDYRWMFFAAGPLEQAASNRALGFEPPADKQHMMGYGTYGAVLDTLEKAVAAHPYIAGDAAEGRLILSDHSSPRKRG